MFTCKPDYEQAQKRLNAFWEHDETDRPLVSVNFPKPNAKPFAAKNYATHKDYWLDIEYRAEQGAHWMESTVFYGESMPVFMPNMGPEILSAWAGCFYHFGETTTWTEPCLLDWENDNATIDMNHPLFRKLEDFTRLLLEKAKGNFIVGLTDLHPGGDHLAALRDPQVLAIDLLENAGMVKAKLAQSYDEYFPVYDHFVNILKSAGMPIASWLPLTSETNMYIPSNDFSCMISTKMFEEFFLDGIVRECKHYDKSIYHLDGPDALRHLDTLLQIKELNAIQWVPGEGRQQVFPWLDVFKRILAAKKSVMAYPRSMAELQFLMDNLPARGLYLQLWNVANENEARNLLKLVERWGT
jgi:hypothetical protein